MILGEFGGRGRPYVQGRLFLPRLRVYGNIDFLVDTGADRTVIHPRDGQRLQLPYEQLQATINMGGIGGTSQYHVEDAYLFFADGRLIKTYDFHVGILRSNQQEALTLPSLLGRDVLDNWWMRYDPPGRRLEFTVKFADITVRAGSIPDSA